MIVLCIKLCLTNLYDALAVVYACLFSLANGILGVKLIIYTVLQRSFMFSSVGTWAFAFILITNLGPRHLRLFRVNLNPSKPKKNVLLLHITVFSDGKLHTGHH